MECAKSASISEPDYKSGRSRASAFSVTRPISLVCPENCVTTSAELPTSLVHGRSWMRIEKSEKIEDSRDARDDCSYGQ